MYDKNKLIPEVHMRKARAKARKDMRYIAIPFACIAGGLLFISFRDMALPLLVSYTICFYLFFDILVDSITNIFFAEKLEDKIEKIAYKYYTEEK